jgi:VanZ family protein
MSMKFHILNTRWPSLIWTALIFVLLSIRVDDLNKGSFLNIPHLDKVVHVFLFGILVFLWARRYFHNSSPDVFKKLIIRIFAMSCLYGIVLEFYQKYFTQRSFDGGDILADIAGAGISYWAFWHFYKKISPYRNRGRNQN